MTLPYEWRCATNSADTEPLVARPGEKFNCDWWAAQFRPVESMAASSRWTRSAASVAPPAVLVRLSDIRCMPPAVAFFDEIVRVLTPIQAISDDRRPYSILG